MLKTPMPITPHQQQMNWFHDSVLLLFFLFIRLYMCMVFVVVAAVCHLSVAFFIFRCAGFNSSVSLKATSNCRWPFFFSLFAFLLLFASNQSHTDTQMSIYLPGSTNGIFPICKTLTICQIFDFITQKIE